MLTTGMIEVFTFVSLLFSALAAYVLNRKDMETPSSEHETPVEPTPEPAPTVPPTVPESEPPKYLWDTPENARHSLRVICDEEGLTVEEKNTMSKVVHCESGYSTHARLDNKDHAGRVWSSDLGICQWNSYWHGKEITPEEAENDPEKAVRLMCKYVKAGEIKQWVCYSSGLYQHFTA